MSWDLPTHSNGILINFSLYCNGALVGVLLQHHRPPPLHFVHVHVCHLCYCVLHAQIALCMVHLYDLCSVRYVLDRSSSHAHRHCTPVGKWCWASSVHQPAQVHCVHFNHLVCVPSFFALIPLSSVLSFPPVSPTPSLPLSFLSLLSHLLPHFLPPFLLPSSSLPPPFLLPSSPLPPSLPHSLTHSLPLSCPPVVMYMYTSRDISGKITHTIYPPSLPSPSPPHFPLLLQYIVIPTFSA